MPPTTNAALSEGATVAAASQEKTTVIRQGTYG